MGGWNGRAEPISRSLGTFLRRLAAAGWHVEAPPVSAPPAVTCCLVARPPSDVLDAAAPSYLVYVFEGSEVVGVDDLWRLVTDARQAECDHPMMCLGSRVRLPDAVRETAARLQVRILRICHSPSL